MPSKHLPTTDNEQLATDKPVIELRHVCKRFGRLTVLDDLSLSVERGKCLVVIGPSGTGKSVMLKHVVGLIAPDAGQVLYDGRRIDLLPQRELMRVRTEFGFLFQMGALFDSMTVADNVAFPLTEHSARRSADVRAVAESKLAMVGLGGLGSKMPMQLSGGQRKRVALAPRHRPGPQGDPVRRADDRPGPDPVGRDQRVDPQAPARAGRHQRRGHPRHAERDEGRRPDRDADRRPDRLRRHGRADPTGRRPRRPPVRRRRGQRRGAGGAPVPAPVSRYAGRRSGCGSRSRFVPARASRSPRSGRPEAALFDCPNHCPVGATATRRRNPP